MFAVECRENECQETADNRQYGAETEETRLRLKDVADRRKGRRKTAGEAAKAISGTKTIFVKLLVKTTTKDYSRLIKGEGE